MCSSRSCDFESFLTESVVIYKTRETCWQNLSVSKSASLGVSFLCLMVLWENAPMTTMKRRKGLFWLTAQNFCPSQQGCKSRYQEREGPGHVASITRRRNKGFADAQLTFSTTIQFRLLAREWCHPQWEDIPMQIRTVKIVPYRHAQRLISQLALDFVKSTINTHHHIG